MEEEAIELIYQKVKNFSEDDELAKKTARRAVRAIKFYMTSIDVPEDDTSIFATRVDGLIQKINKDIFEQIIEGELRCKTLITTDIYDISTELKNKKIYLTNKLAPTNTNCCTIYKCPRCKERKHTYTEKQRRSLDEPSSIICVCLVCGMKFVIG